MPCVLWRWSKLHCIDNYNYDDCFSTYGYKFIIFIVLIKFNIYRMCFYEYLSFSGMMLVL